MTDTQQRAAAKAFAEFWKGKGYEKGQSQIFWTTLLTDVYGVTDVARFIEFEDQVHLDHTSFIDGYIPSTKVLIEQKGLGKNLNEAIKQSDGSKLTPFQQAKRYITELPLSRHPRWVVTCNFEEFYVYDMENPRGEPEKIKLADLEKEFYRLSFLVDTGSVHLQREMEISIKAGEVVGLLYDAFLKQYKNPDSDEAQKSLNKLCVRLVFCLYAEDAGIFGKHMMFHDYLNQFSVRDMRKGLLALFKVLDQKPEERDEFLADDDPLLAAFPYVNGGLFADEDIIIPPFTDEIRDLLLVKASADFDWSDISPTIFGAVFESTLNPDTRRAGGMHYTSIENIHKVIDPLFLDDLKKELEDIKADPIIKTRNNKLEAYQDKLASLQFLDPAAGSGNFLTESYLSLRKIENEVIALLNANQVTFGETKDPIKVSINQFHGIEINDFAVTVAKTALWIAESQMMKETESIVYTNLDFLPLKTNANIVEGNALRIDWNDVVPKERLSYIMGNPPFIGSSIMAQGSKQKDDVHHVFPNLDKNEVQDLDYVTCWYKIAAEYMQGTKIECCFVSTNSICQGSQVPILWNILLNSYQLHINFAYQTFIWNSESTNQAAVHCVIICFSTYNRTEKLLFKKGQRGIIVPNISPYLTNGDDTFVTARKTPICDVPGMNFGNQPRDGGFLVISEEEKSELLQAEPALVKWLREYIGAVEFINHKQRWCLWLKHAEPSDIKTSKILYSKVEAVREFRLASRAKTTNGYAKVPHLFAQITQPENVDFLLIPRVSSERRRYIPIGFMNKDIIASDAVQIVPNADLFHFGILTSNVHMAWMRTIAGRLKSDYRYSKEVVYNTFPWPSVTSEQREKIVKTAQDILKSRALYPNSSYADLYDDLTMPPDLRTAHQKNDRAVMDAYGFPKTGFTESDCVAALMKFYQEKVQQLEQKTK